MSHSNVRLDVGMGVIVIEVKLMLTVALWLLDQFVELQQWL